MIKEKKDIFVWFEAFFCTLEDSLSFVQSYDSSVFLYLVDGTSRADISDIRTTSNARWHDQ